MDSWEKGLNAVDIPTSVIQLRWLNQKFIQLLSLIRWGVHELYEHFSKFRTNDGFLTGSCEFELTASVVLTTYDWSSLRFDLISSAHSWVLFKIQQWLMWLMCIFRIFWPSLNKKSSNTRVGRHTPVSSKEVGKNDLKSSVSSGHPKTEKGKRPLENHVSKTSSSCSTSTWNWRWLDKLDIAQVLIGGEGISDNIILLVIPHIPTSKTWNQ